MVTRAFEPSRRDRARREAFVLAAVLLAPGALSAQTVSFDGGVHKYAALSNLTVYLSGRSELWLSSGAAPLPGSTVNLDAPDAWLFLTGLKPSRASSLVLGQVQVSGAPAVNGGNVRVVQYGDGGAIVIPQGPSFPAFTTYAQPQFTGGSATYRPWSTSTGGQIPPFSSFVLKRGYQAVLAQSANGKVASKCYVAQDGDLEVGVLPSALDQQVKFVSVTPWRWTSKKGTAGDPGIPLLNTQWWYNWNISATSSPDLEYVAIRQNQWWPNLTQNWHALGINTILGYNEPDNAGQANLSVATALGAWGDVLATGLRTGSPATTDGGRQSWLYPFVNQADAAGLRVDFIATHYYWAWNPADPQGAANLMYGFLADIWNNTHRPIWITEWNNGANWTDNNPYPVPSYAQQQACIGAMVQMLESTPFVERYAPYNWVEDPRALVTNGAPTAAGVVFSNQVSAIGYVQAMPDNGLRGVARYLFRTNTWDESGYANNAMAVGAPAYGPGRGAQDTAITLDGLNSHLQLPANIARGNALTFAAWVFWDGGANWQRIFDFGNDTSHYLFLTPHSSAGTLRFAVNNGAGEQLVEAPGLPAGTWQHVAVTLSGADGAVLYRNGVVVASSRSVTIPPSAVAPRQNYLGKSQFPADPHLHARLQDVVVSDLAMIAADIAGLMTNRPSSLPFCSLQGGHLALSWPADHLGWRLLTQTNPPTGGVDGSTSGWTTVAGSAQTNRWVLPLPAGAPAGFYRLVYP